jgi:hypothetical protein
MSGIRTGRACLRRHGSPLRGLVVAACLVALSSSVGCTNRVAILSLAAADSSEDWPLLVLQPKAEGRACSSKLLRFIPIGNAQPPLEAAIQEAVGQVADAQLLTNVMVDLETIDVIIFSRSCMRVHGTAARRARVIHVH